MGRGRWVALVPALAAVVVAGMAGGAGADGGGPARANGAAPARAVIVRARDASAAAEAVRAVGGVVVRSLPIVSGVAARVPQAAAAALAKESGIRVTDDAVVHVAGTTTTNTQTVNSVFSRETNADKLWAQGIDGSGVTVALVDTGVAAVPDLAGRIAKVPDPTGAGGPDVDCVDFSGEGSCNDSYGHGTFIAGLIAGSGASSGGLYRGVAPGARIVSVKIAGRDGSADVSKVLAAIQWVVSFADRLHIKVLNLSLGTDSSVSYTVDPLDYAVERAWRAGITVVVAASNRGPAPHTISKPGDDPFVITVGAVDDRETPGIDDDRLPDFSGRGTTAADGLVKPDVVAPGGRVVSLRSPGSTIDAKAPVPAGDLYSWGYRRGSGTSMATGIVSGLAALTLQARPAWTPDRVKYAMMATAQKVAARDVLGVGQGLVDVQAALGAPAGLANGGILPSAGTGSIDGSRGTEYVTRSCGLAEPLLDPMCDRVHGDKTGQDKTFDASQYQGDWTGSSWYSSQWVGSSWYGSSWYGSSWYGSSWYGSSWYGSEDTTFYGTSVAGSSWYGAWQ